MNLLTGNFQYSAGDVAVPGNLDNDLSIGRTLNTATIASTNGIFGPGWTASLPVDAAGVDYTGLADTGSVLTATYSDQSTINFGKTSTTGQYAPTGPDYDSGLLVKTDTTTSGCSTGSPDYRRCYDLTDLDGNTTVSSRSTAAPARHFRQPRAAPRSGAQLPTEC